MPSRGIGSLFATPLASAVDLVQQLLPRPLKSHAQAIVALAAAGTGVLVLYLLRSSSQSTPKHQKKSCCNDKHGAHVEDAKTDAPIEVPRAYVAPPRDPEEITEPVEFISASVVEAVVTDEGSLDYGGVDSDEYPSLNTSLDTTHFEGTPNDSSAVYVNTTGAEAVPAADDSSSSVATITADESHVEEPATPIVDAASLLAQYAHGFLARRDTDPAHIHPAHVGYAWAARSDPPLSTIDADPAVSSPVFFGGSWQAPDRSIFASHLKTAKLPAVAAAFVAASIAPVTTPVIEVAEPEEPEQARGRTKAFSICESADESLSAYETADDENDDDISPSSNGALTAQDYADGLKAVNILHVPEIRVAAASPRPSNPDERSFRFVEQRTSHQPLPAVHLVITDDTASNDATNTDTTNDDKLQDDNTQDGESPNTALNTKTVTVTVSDATSTPAVADDVSSVQAQSVATTDVSAEETSESQDAGELKQSTSASAFSDIADNDSGAKKSKGKKSRTKSSGSSKGSAGATTWAPGKGNK